MLPRGNEHILYVTVASTGCFNLVLSFNAERMEVCYFKNVFKVDVRNEETVFVNLSSFLVKGQNYIYSAFQKYE